MASFNLYIDKIDIDLWREFCQREGKLRHYLKREYFLRIGEVPQILWIYRIWLFQIYSYRFLR